MAALRAGKHVLVEKPMTSTSEQANRLIDEAAARRLVLMVDHTFVYTGAVRKMRELVETGELGDIYYYDSVRINLGLFQHDVNVLWDLAVHDLSIMDFVLRQQPVAVSATGLAHVQGRPENIAYMTMFFDGSLIAHVQRQLAVAGEGAPDAARRQPPHGRVRRSRGEREDQGLRPRHLAEPQPGERLPDARRLPRRRHVGAADCRERGAHRRGRALRGVRARRRRADHGRRGGPARRAPARSRDRVDGPAGPAGDARRARRSDDSVRRSAGAVPSL